MQSFKRSNPGIYQYDPSAWQIDCEFQVRAARRNCKCSSSWKKTSILIMIYCIIMQIFNSKHLYFRPHKNNKSDKFCRFPNLHCWLLQILNFVTAYNIRNFNLKFYTLIEYNIASKVFRICCTSNLIFKKTTCSLGYKNLHSWLSSSSER
jgi:hypothetical protein